MSEAPAFDRNPLAPLGFLAKTGLCQAIAAGAAVVLWGLLSSVWATILAASACAVLAAAFLRLSTPWIAVNAILPFGAASALAVQIPHEIFLMLLVALACTYLPAFWTRVPYYPTQRAAYSTILAQLPADRAFSFVDIGCGFGDLLALLGDKRPNGTFVGIEIGLLPFIISKVRFLRTTNVTIRFQSMWSLSMNDFDVVYAFLSPAPMERLWRKAKDEMREGTMLISNSFPAPAEPTEMIPIRDSRGATLFLYAIGETETKRATTGT